MPFIASCTRFLFLDEESRTTAPSKTQAREPEKNLKELKGNSKLMDTLRRAVKASEEDDGWAKLGPVGSHISNLGPFDHRTYGFSKLSDLFAAIDLFEVKKEKNGSRTIISVRQKKGPATKKSSPPESPAS